MGDGHAIVIEGRRPEDLPRRTLAAYDREIGIELVYEDPAGEEHYLVHYPAGLRARTHRHPGAQTIVVLDGRLAVEDRVLGPGGYCHFPAGEAMFHAPARGSDCFFLTIFHGPSDVEILDRDPRPASV
ncbi:MAG: cupin domain-containing protein [Candidatus Velamenicoccus archaeovorus]